MGRRPVAIVGYLQVIQPAIVDVPYRINPTYQGTSSHVTLTHEILLYLCLSSSLGLTSAAAEPNVSITVQQVQKNTHIVASIQIPATSEIVWQVLTDYDRLADFIAPLETSRLVETKNDSTFLVEQTSIGRFAIFKRRSRALFLSHHLRRERITTTFIEGDFHTHQFEWRLTSVVGEDTGPEATILTYEATVRSTYRAPTWIIHYIVKKAVRQTILDIRSESLNRARPSIPAP